ncbi:ABC transporter ATP-binding protein [Yinghuangia soli]|uniref:ABC transporter ATP-binding protein n=1 Tax=Yinghuangia soli TaxID=2908204 RepID=A0AA41TZX1_9ACTN|nr:ABC transporter ATP-binding protein [Yinghuangia soli]MCF2527956.1 ABC transporter ATP-binding protein [Yinghuangia soli]
MLELRDVHTYYGASHVLQGVSLTVGEGEVLGILGRNGMGKTTLVHTIAGLLRPRRGTIEFRGRRIGGAPAERIARAGMALVPQGHRIFPSLTVKENLKVAVRRGTAPEPWTIDDVVDRFPVLGERFGLSAGLLSGGQQQMLALGRALVGNGSLVLLDEPTEGLDPQTVARVGDVVDELRGRGTSAILVEQKVDFALRRVDRALVLERGHVVHTTDKPQELRTDTAALRELLAVGGAPSTAPSA